MIASLQSVGVGITYDALMKRVARASVEDSIAEIRIPKSSAESEVSSLSPHEQADDSLTSENTATSHVDQSLGTPELKSRVGGRPKGPQIKVTMRTMMLPMLWRDCLGWLPSEGSLQTLLRGMESKGVLTRMMMNMDGENI